jgi:polyhydroxyalkanoate synthesis regulator phasin
MAKKDKKKKDTGESGAADAVEAVRAAVERTFRATTEGAAGTQKRTRELVDEVAHAAARIRETIEDLRVLEDVRGLRAEIEELSRRVALLEAADRAKSTAAKPRTTTTRAKRTPAKPSGTRSSAQRPASS